ncbi:collagen alpha-1(I) chain-like [Penaeus monodon]|uniref:collagen alpha-1(I) chain-like n=1 Tax=Penaeus monodon TaxID=6687 RepID=UPI0018A70F8D|nr:collagen alpha-1(I) chain-like [Penaeus monodon]
MPVRTRPHRPPRPHAARAAVSCPERSGGDSGSNSESSQLALRGPGRRRKPGAGEGPPASHAVRSAAVRVRRHVLEHARGRSQRAGGRGLGDRGRGQHARGRRQPPCPATPRAPPTPCGAPTDPGSATGAGVVRGRAHDPVARGPCELRLRSKEKIKGNTKANHSLED